MSNFTLKEARKTQSTPKTPPMNMFEYVYLPEPTTLSSTAPVGPTNGPIKVGQGGISSELRAYAERHSEHGIKATHN